MGENHKTQRDQLLGLLLRANGNWVSLLEILDLRIAQYNARVHELRKLNFEIESRTQTIDGQRHSWFRLLKGNPPVQADLPLQGASGTLVPVGTRGRCFERIYSDPEEYWK